MSTVAAYRMQIQPHLGQSPQDCVQEVRTHFSDFVVKYYRGRKVEIFPLRFDGHWEYPKQGNRLVAAHYVCTQHALATLDWELEDGSKRTTLAFCHIFP